MERLRLPEKAQGNILWIGPQNGLVTTWTRSTPVNGQPLVWVMLWQTKDGGVTWEKKWPKQGRSLQQEIATDNVSRWEDRTSIVQDHQGNIYIHRSNKVIRGYKTGPDSWDFNGYTIPQWRANYARAPIVMATGVNQLFIVTVDSDNNVIEYTTNNLTKWNTQSRIGRNRFLQADTRWPRAGLIYNGYPRWFYMETQDSTTVLRMAGDINNMGARPSEIVHTFPTPTTMGAMAATQDQLGRLHVIWSEQPSKKIMHKMKIGPTWTDPIELAVHGGYSINTITTDNIPGFQMEAETTPYMQISSDGIGLMIYWAEISEPGVFPRTFTFKKLHFDGTVWSTPELIDGPIDYELTKPVKFIGNWNINNFGIHSLIVRDGLADDDIFLYPLTIPYNPYAPKDLAPANGLASEDLERSLSWRFSDPVPGDSQSAYQIQIFRHQDSELLWDSGKIISPELITNIPAGIGLVLGAHYQWRVRTWDASNLEGAWSDLALFKTSAKPTGVLTVPVEDEVFATDAPEFEWTYSDPEGLPQIGYRIQIIDPATDLPIYDTQFISSAVVTYRLPAQIVLNGGTYIARLFVQDLDGIVSEPDDRTFSIEYIAPAAPEVLPEIDEFGGVVLNIISSNPANNSWMEDYFTVYRKELGQPEFEILEPSVLLPQIIVDDFESTTQWGAAGVALDPIIVEAKEGINALGFGTSAAGNGRNTKPISIEGVDQYDQAQIWLYTVDNTKFENLRVQFGTNLQNYYYIDIPAEELTNDEWVSFKFSIDGMMLNGDPRRHLFNSVGVSIMGATEAIPLGDVRADHLRLLSSSINYYDRSTVIDKQYIYAVSSYAIVADLSSSITTTAPQLAKFLNPYINTQLIPMDLEDVSLEGFMDSSKPPGWSSITETQYYHTRGSTKPIAVINAIESYKEGSIEIRFFDPRFGGRGLEAAETLEYLKNSKPILLRTWWGRNYYISIDGEINVVRRPGIGWFASFNFTEINP